METPLNELFAALAKAQSEMDTAQPNAANPFFKSRYADLAEIVRVSRYALTKNGLAVTQFTMQENDQQVLVTILGHSSGQWLKSTMLIAPTDNKVQSLGGYITYLRRYMYAAMVGVVVSEEDDDGNIASGKSVAQQVARITPKQVDTLVEAINDDPNLMSSIKSHFGIKFLDELAADKFTEALKMIIKERNSD